MTLGPLAQNLVATLLDQLGADGTIVRKDETYNRATGRVVENNPPTEIPVKCSPPAAVGRRRIEQGLAIVGDLETIIAAKGLATPTAKVDNFRFPSVGGTTYKIEALEAIHGGNEVAAFALILRA